MRKRSIFTLLACMTLLNACGSKDNSLNEQPVSPVYHKISAEEAKQMMSESTGYILLDVRTDEEFKEKRIEGAVLIPDYEISSRAALELTDKEAVILVYCRSGRRSANVAHELVDMGYSNVYDFGGIIDWPYDTAGK